MNVIESCQPQFTDSLEIKPVTLFVAFNPIVFIKSLSYFDLFWFVIWMAYPRSIFITLLFFFSIFVVFSVHCMDRVLFLAYKQDTKVYAHRTFAHFKTTVKLSRERRTIF